MKDFSIIGAGRLGTSLGSALVGAGWTLRFIADRKPDAAREGRRLIGSGKLSGDNSEAAGGARVIFICVPDDAISPLVRDLAGGGANWAGRTVFHTSGLLPSTVLSPLRRKGARAASVHPVQSFPEKGGSKDLFKNIFWGIEGDEEALRTADRIIRSLGGNALRLAPTDKAVYHAACSLASNAFVALTGAAADILAGTGLSPDQAAAVLLPLVQGTLQNVKNLGFVKALTGPIVRGDLGTVRRHLEALRTNPRLEEVYRSLGRLALDKSVGDASSPTKIRSLRRLLEDGRPLPPGGCRKPRRRGP